MNLDSAKVSQVKNALHSSLSGFLSNGAPMRSSCNPFQSLGYVDSKDNTWKTINQDCPAPNRTQIQSLLPHLRNKRIYFYGDSVLRFALMDICKTMLGRDFEAIPDPPGYFSVGDMQKVHHCTIPELNFTAVQVFGYGLTKYDDSDIPFLSNKDEFNFTADPNPASWRMESRISNPHPTLVKMFGPADVVIMNSGLWDLFWLQRRMVVDKIRLYNQSLEPPVEFIEYHKQRVQELISMARGLNPGVTKLFYVVLHDPPNQNIPFQYGLEGHKSSIPNVRHSAFHTARVQSIRYATKLAILEEEHKGWTDLDMIPLDAFMRETRVAIRGRDWVHPTAPVNQILGMSILWHMKQLFPEIK
jgi:hypothetical protein